MSNSTQIYPQQEGGLYWLTGYPASGMNSFGVAVIGSDIHRPGYVIWVLAMDDGDYYDWPEGKALPNMPCDGVKLVRRMADIKAEALKDMGIEHE